MVGALKGNLQEFGGHAFQTKIPMDNQLETLEPGAKTGGAEAYTSLADEVMEIIQAKPTRQEQKG